MGGGRTDGRTGWGEGSRACELEQLRNISRQLARLVGWLLKRLKPFFLPHPSFSPSLPLPFRPFVVCDILWRFVSGSGGVGGRGIRFNNQLLHIFRCPCNVRRIGGGGRTGGGRTNSLGQEFRTYYARIPNCLASPAADPTPPPPRVNGRASG